MVTPRQDPEHPILKGRNKPNHPNRLRAAELARQVLIFRRAGATWEDIASRTGRARSTCMSALDRALVEYRAEIGKDLDKVRAMQLARLDAALIALSDRIQKGDDKALGHLIKIEERRAKLLGLDAPSKVAMTDPTGNAAAVLGLRTDSDGLRLRLEHLLGLKPPETPPKA